MNTITLLRVAGVLLLVLVVLNLFVPRRFGWGEELSRVSLLNRQIFIVHAGFILLVLLLMAALTLALPHELVAPSPLSRAILLGLTLFWLIRLLVQWFYYDSRIWRGHRFNTTMHYLFTGVWCYFVGTFAFAWWKTF